MGDAGPVTPAPSLTPFDGAQQRQVTVLVTGFGPFKTFTTNPSHLIAQRLPPYLLSHHEPPAFSPSASIASSDILPPSTAPSIIRLIVHPDPIRVAYATLATLPAKLIAEHDPDYVFHIGMAGGRDYYTLETLAQRDSYRIRDVDDLDGYVVGERRWRAEGLPELLRVGWEEEDVLRRWKQEVAVTCVDAKGKGDEKAVVRLSKDAGRFTCDFILYESLSIREKEAVVEEGTRTLVHGQQEVDVRKRERRGKAAFFHVPGATDEESIVRGVRVAEAAIRSLVGSWEEGYRAKEIGKATVA